MKKSSSVTCHHNVIANLNITRLLRSIIILTLMFMASSCYKNPIERNTIVFEDEVQHVHDSLIEMLKLLPLLPERSDNLNTNYTINNGALYTNYGFLNDSIVETGDPFARFSVSEKKEFTDLAFYLNKNHISSGYYDESSSIWRFVYRDIPDLTHHDIREIVIISTQDSKLIGVTDTVLDEEGQLYLMAPIDAKIR